MYIVIFCIPTDSLDTYKSGNIFVDIPQNELRFLTKWTQVDSFAVTRMKVLLFVAVVIAVVMASPIDLEAQPSQAVEVVQTALEPEVILQDLEGAETARRGYGYGGGRGFGGGHFGGGFGGGHHHGHHHHHHRKFCIYRCLKSQKINLINSF